jgi:hypothetical protein
MFRFTMRDVLWLTVVVALGLGWWVDSKRIEKTVKRVEELQTDLEDRMTVLDEVQKDAAKGLLPGPGMVKALDEATAAARTAKESAADKN